MGQRQRERRDRRQIFRRQTNPHEDKAGKGDKKKKVVLGL